MNIGKLQISGKVLLAPMCDVTALPFRLICKKYGAAIVYTEMINADAFVMGSKKTIKRAQFIEEERPFGIQLSGSNIINLKNAAIKAEKEIKPDLIDINFGCPAYNVMKTGSGAAALRDKDFLYNLVYILSSSIKIPLTCKMRILPDRKNTISAAKIVEKAGAKALTVHGRTASQKYTGESDWRIIKDIKNALKIPVILNGDIIDEESAFNALKTGCDAIMVGRAAINNPFIFKQINHYLNTGKKLQYPKFSDKVEDYKNIIKLCKKYDCTNIKSLKMLAQSFTKGQRNSSSFRKQIVQCKTDKDILNTMQNYYLYEKSLSAKTQMGIS